MMKLRPKLVDTKSGWGGWDTWVPVGVVLVAVGLHLAEVIDAAQAAIPVALALLYTMGEPVVAGLLRRGQFPGWARAAGLLLVLGGVAWGVVAVVYWALPGTVVAEGDLTQDQTTLQLRPEAPGETRDYILEVSTPTLPEGDEPVTFHYQIRLGDEQVGGSLGKEFRIRRFRKGSGKTLESKLESVHRVRASFRPGDKLEAVTFPADLPGPLHVYLRESPFTRLTLLLISIPFALLAVLVEAFERRKRESTRLAAFVTGLMAAVAYFLMAVLPDNLLMGVLGSAIAGLAGAGVGWALAWLLTKPLRRLVHAGPASSVSSEPPEPAPPEEPLEPSDSPARPASVPRGRKIGKKR